MFTASELEGVPIQIEQTVKDMQQRCMEDIVRRIEINGEITSSADWQIQRLTQLGMAQEDIQRNIQDALKITDKQIEALYSDVLKQGYVRDASLYTAAGMKRTSYENDIELQRIISAAKEQTRGAMQNITQTLGVARVVDGKMEYTDLTKYYQDTLDGAVMDIVSGTASYEEVLKRAVNEMTTSGIRSIDYASGRSYRADSAARTAVMTGFNQVVGKMNDETAQKLGIDTFEVEWHGGARPSHQVWQGRVYTRKQLVDVCGLGRVDGLLGANCYHSYNPFYPGISKRNYSDEWLDRMHKEENTPKTYQGKEYTRYEALQAQRHMELQMRKYREEIDLLTLGNGSQDDILNMQIKNKIVSDEYVKFSKAMGIPEQMQRVEIIGRKNQVYEAGISGKRVNATAANTVDLQGIAKKSYSNKYEKLPYSTEAVESIRSQAKASLIHRSGTNKEDFYLVHKDSGKILGSSTAATVDDRVVYGNNVKAALRNYDHSDMVAIHNHATNAPPTGSDFASVFRNGYDGGVVATHDGKVYYYSMRENLSAKFIDATIADFQEKGYTNYHERALKELADKYALTWKEL